MERKKMRVKNAIITIQAIREKTSDMRLIDADALEKTLGEWIRDHWTEAFTGDDAGSEFADMIDHAETIPSGAKMREEEGK